MSDDPNEEEEVGKTTLRCALTRPFNPLKGTAPSYFKFKPRRELYMNVGFYVWESLKTKVPKAEGHAKKMITVRFLDSAEYLAMFPLTILFLLTI